MDRRGALFGPMGPVGLILMLVVVIAVALAARSALNSAADPGNQTCTANDVGVQGCAPIPQYQGPPR